MWRLLLSLAFASGQRLEITRATRVERRLLVQDEVLEYIEIDLHFSAPVYVTACGSPVNAVYVWEAQRCASCPKGCTLSAAFSRFPYVPDLLPRVQSTPECICGVSYEEIQLRSQAWPGDQGVDSLTNRRLALIHSIPETRELYSSGLWKFDALIASIKCPNEANMTPALARIRRFGINGMPLDNSLLWARRMETAFGVEDLHRLLANASKSYNSRRAIFLLPVRRTKNGRTRQLGLTLQELAPCSLELGQLTGPHGEPAESVPRIGDLPVKELTCRSHEVEAAHRQMKAVMDQVLSAGRQEGHCVSDWRTTFPARGPGGPGGTSGKDYIWGDAPENGTYSPYTTVTSEERLRKVGILSYRRDFKTPTQEERMPCSVYRWQLRLRAHNMRERAVSYTASDEVNGCWSRMEHAFIFQTKSVTRESQSCRLEPEDTAFRFDPCCNLQRLRQQCCAKRPNVIEQPSLTGANKEALAKCRAERRGSYVRAAASAALSWQRRLWEPSGTQMSWKQLAVQEQASSSMWRALEQCHADVMGRFDRETGLYMGLPCLVDSDCFTRCRKPALESLQVKVALKEGSPIKTLVLGRCTVPSDSRHVYLVRCLARRLGKEVVELLAAELGVDQRQRSEDAVLNALVDPLRMTSTFVCVGPYATPGVEVTQAQCLSRLGCNWHHEIRTQADCIADQFQNNQFCGCVEGLCPQQSRRAGCITGAVYTDYCSEARELLRPLELACAIIATTAADLSRCRALADAHSFMYRWCISLPCNPRDVYFLADEKCNDNMRREFQACYDSCVMPSGPNPDITLRDVCFYELWENETDQDCYLKPGDTTVHYSPPVGAEGIEENWAGALTLEVPKTRRPRYCSIRFWQELQQSYRPRSLSAERARLLYRLNREQTVLEIDERRTEGARRQDEVFLTQEPERFFGCDLGPLPLTPESSAACRAKTEYVCCFSPDNLTSGSCEFCNVANTTSCAIGQKLLAIWAPNLQPYAATLAEDLGSDLARVDWEDGDIYYRQVPWSWLRTNAGGCHPVGEGCAAHSQCPFGSYCFSCTTCAMAYGGNPPPGLCDPCPTHRGGGCGSIDSCVRLQDSVDGQCPTEGLRECPCKAEWSVRYQYPGAPTEQSINGCYFDRSSNSRWCEVDDSFANSGCNLKRMVGVDRFIYWQTCRPNSCDHCSCDCSSNCQAFDVLPVEGRLPLEVVSGLLEAMLPSSLKLFAGTIAPNCTQGSSARIRDVCDYCVACCNDFCNEKAREQGGFDCTTTQVSGCSDMVHGWVDSVGRDCTTYVTDSLCTLQGLYGTNWVYNPPRSFADFSSSNLAATTVCCDCGGGVDCSDAPFDWVDADGHPCSTYEALQWCNRMGYGPGWDLQRGPFTLGTAGVDAHTACCICGGGTALSRPEVINNLVDSESTCLAVWPGRAQWRVAPWYQRSIHLCQLGSNICARKLQATVYDPGRATNVADDERIFGLCLQRAYDTGTLPYLEDFEMSLTPVGVGRRLNGSNGSRELAVLDRSQDMDPTELTKQLFVAGASVRADFFGNRGRGMCMYRLPDARQMFGGPNRIMFPPPLLPPATGMDPFERPSLQLLGWPRAFFPALFEGGDAQLAMDRAIGEVFGGQPIDTSTEISSVLRGLLASRGISIVPEGEFQQRVQQWINVAASVQCQGPVDDLTKFSEPSLWQPAILHNQVSCEVPRCDVDEMIQDDLQCRLTYGCTAECTFCASQALLTQDNGLCVSEDIQRCGELGGLVVEGDLFDERMGVTRSRRLCALRHRPMMYCMGPGFFIKRCENFDEASCESDPISKLMGCFQSVRPCQTEDLCTLSGHCSDRDIGLSLASPGTCVITPMDDQLIQQGCIIGGSSSFPDGSCFFALDPPFGMEVRQKHGLTDLSEQTSGNVQGSDLEEAAAWAASLQEAQLTAETTDPDRIRRRLREVGRLNRSECEELKPAAPFQAVWIERSVTPTSCAKWKACCLLRRGDRCELFISNVVDTSKLGAEAAAVECAACGGEWLEVFEWTPGVWKRGDLVNPRRGWFNREWGSVNRWAEVVDVDELRRVLENALETRLGQQRLNAVMAMVEPLMTSLKSFAAACGEESEVLDASVERGERLQGKKAPPPALQLPSPLIHVGQVLATSGLISSGSVGAVELSWHEFTASRFGDTMMPAVRYDISILPFENLLGMAAPQIALPGRAALVRSYLLEFMVFSDTTTSLSPASMESIDAGGIRGGYPAWIINEMIKLDIDPEAEAQEAADLAARLTATEETRRQERIRAAEERARAADTSTGLPSASLYVVTEFQEYLENATVSGDPLSESCRSVVGNAQGEVFGRILGDCVHLSSSATIENALELCVPLTYGSQAEIEAFNATEQAMSVGMRFDFALASQVPATYETRTPTALAEGAEVPGRLGPVMWTWEDSETWGRLLPGWLYLTPSSLPAELRSGSAGPRLCSKIYTAGQTYCPIVRLSTHPRSLIWTNASGRPKVLGFDSDCRGMDELVSEVYALQRERRPGSLPYVVMEQQVSEVEVLQERADLGVLPSIEAASNLPLCLPGQCMAQRGNGFEIQDSSEAGCAIFC